MFAKLMVLERSAMLHRELRQQRYAMGKIMTVMDK
jgi:hypothetical protein